jgi:hypothetical protein
MKRKEYNKVIDEILKAKEQKHKKVEHIVSKKTYIQIQDRLLNHFEELSVKILKDKVIINISNIKSEVETENLEEDKKNDFELM